jgi:hypothetical protein
MPFSPTDDLTQGARRVPLQPTARLGYTATYISCLNLRQASHHQQQHKTLCQTSYAVFITVFSLSQYVCLALLLTG